MRTKWISLFFLFFVLSVTETAYCQKEKASLREIVLFTDTTFVRAHVSNRDKIELNDTLLYFWYGNENIKANYGGFSGLLLHGAYEVFDRSDNLLEKGTFSFGLKDGDWKKWDAKGNLLLSEVWEKGRLYSPKIREKGFAWKRIRDRFKPNEGKQQ